MAVALPYVLLSESTVLFTVIDGAVYYVGGFSYTPPCMAQSRPQNTAESPPTFAQQLLLPDRTLAPPESTQPTTWPAAVI